MPQIKVTFAELEKLQGDIKATAKQINDEIEAIKTTVNGTNAYWSGSAQDHFNARYTQLKTAQTNVQQAIDQFGGLIGRALQAYMDAETKVGGMFK
jgi:WXG100 family type VII secretion target